MKKILVYLIITSLLFTLVGCKKKDGFQDVSNTQHKESQKPLAPSFVGKSLFSDEQINFPDDFKGKLVYLTFFSPG